MAFSTLKAALTAERKKFASVGWVVRELLHEIEPEVPITITYDQ
jgi:hypothetical protein